MSRQTQAPTTPRWNRRDLIERLQLKRDIWRGTEFGDDICELLDEAAAALEAVERDIALIDPTTVSAQLVEWSERNLTDEK